jgi:putative membrane protein
MNVSDIPGINACLNGLSTILMTLGFIFIKRGDKETHRKLMLSAGTVSAVFLIGYVSHKVMVRGVHTDFERHKKWAKWTFPIWYYVSVTGVLVYLFLYQWWPSAG